MTTIPRRGTMAGRGAVAVTPDTQIFNDTGASQDFIVPTGVTTLTVDLYGAQGGTSGAGHAGGLGGRVKCDVTVTPGETLHIHVGRKGLTGNPFGNVSGGWNGGGIGTNGGGSGGGATDIRRTPYANADRLAVAGAGGGTGGNGGAGVGTGGAGATPIGSAGGGGTFCSLAGGGGGTSSAGGAAGTCSCTAQAGALATGGDGCNFSGSYRGGAGGGGGRYGGGGAGSGSAGSTGGGGGGGSGLSTGTNETLTTGVRNGNGLTIITWGGLDSLLALQLTDGAVLAMPFQEASVAPIDASGRHAPTVPVAGVSTITGGPGGKRAYRFSGAADNRVQVADSASLDVANVFTFECWHRPGTLGTTQTLIGRGTGAGGLRRNASNQLQMVRNNIADIAPSTVTLADTGHWYHCVGTKNGSTVKLYVDGVDVTGTVTDSTCVANALPLGVGAWQDVAWWEELAGDIAYVAVYPTALSAGQVSNHFTAVA